ncbi:MAG: CHAT domain-containing protein [Lysobacterales bacterium]
MREFIDATIKVFAVLFAVAAGLAIGIALVLVIEIRDVRADEVPLPDDLKAAETVYRSDGPEAALPEFQRLAAKYGDSGDRRAEGVAIRFIGEIQWRLGDFDNAEQNLLQALSVSAEVGDRSQQARVLNVLGLLEWDRGNLEQALTYFTQAGDLAEAIDDQRMVGALLNNSSLVHDERGEYLDSLAQYREALAHYEGIDFPRGRGDTLGNIGGVYLLLGQYREALGYYRQALEISEQLESVTSMSQDHGNIALCLLGLGEVEESIGHFDQAIELAGQAGSKQDVAYWTRGKANALIREGHHEQGLELHRQAVAQYQAVGARTEAVEAMHDLGRLYLVLGDSASASDWFGRSLGLAREVGLERGVTLNLLALGDLQVRQQLPEEAAALYGQAWQRAQAAGEANLAAESLLRLADTHREQGQLPEAQQEASQALEISKRIESPYGMAEAQYQLAELDRLQSELHPALVHYGSALDALPDIPDPELAWRIHYGKGLALADLDELQPAIAELRQAIVFIETVRDRLSEQRFRSGYVQDKYEVYVDLVRLQMRTGANADAFATAERLRARSYRDLLESSEAPPMAGAEQQRAAELIERIRRLRRVLNEESRLPTGQQRRPAISVYTAELLAAEEEYEALLESGLQAGPSGPARPPSYEAVRTRLANGEALVEYVVAEDSVLTFVLTAEDLQAVSSPLGRDDLSSKVELLRDLLRRPESDRWQRPALSLSQALIEPIRTSGALSGTSYIYLVPHGILNYLPFAVLPSGEDGETPLVDQFTLAYLPTAEALLDVKFEPRGEERLLAMAPERSRLKHASEEASRVFELFDAKSRLLVGEAATESLFKDVAGDFDVVHLATHGYFNKVNPMLSGLELEADDDNDGLLELHEILGLHLHADLVTLSACETGLGSGHFAEIPAGDDFVGLTRAFLSAGSEAVMATLWEVDDASTADLMAQFYTRLHAPAGAPDKAGALAEAQRRMQATKKYHHPYYWAPFVLVGASGQQAAVITKSAGV